MKSGYVIRRIPDEAGELVTYLAAQPLQELVEISSSCVSRWSRTGAIRHTDKLDGRRNYSVVDAVQLKLMSVKESQALGVKRTLDADLALSYRWRAERQQETRPRAHAHRDRWTDRDHAFLLSAFQEGRPLEVIARVLGRTYGAVTQRLDDLREDGDLPWVRLSSEDWLSRACSFLTLEEVAKLESST